jgi:poly(A) polymerase
MRVEMVEGIILAHPFNSSFDKVYYCTTDDEASQVATGETIRHLRAESTNLQKTALAAESGIDSVKETEGVSLAPDANIVVYTSTFYIGLNISPKDGKFPQVSSLSSEQCFVAVTGETRKLDISWPSQEFYDICRHSPGYVEDSMNVSIKHIRK